MISEVDGWKCLKSNVFGEVIILCGTESIAIGIAFIFCVKIVYYKDFI